MLQKVTLLQNNFLQFSGAGKMNNDAKLTRTSTKLWIFFVGIVDFEKLYIDCHCHLTSDRFVEDLDSVIARAERVGVRSICVCSSSQLDIARVVELRELYPHIVFPCLGIHPLDASFSFSAGAWEWVENAIRAAHWEKGIVSVGEIGLDFSYPILRERAAAKGITINSIKDSQVSLFEAQISLALDLGVPVNVHSRNAESRTLEILERSGVRGVMHAYKGDVSLAVQAAKAGRLFFSFPPSIVYKQEYQEVAKALPADVLLLETDSPSLGAKGPKERNEPCFIKIAANKIAELRGVSVEEVVAITSQNAIRLFGALALGLSQSPNINTEASLQHPGSLEAVPDSSVANRPRRWRTHKESTIDKTLCSAAFGSAFCD